MTQDTTRSQIKATLIDHGVTQVSGAMLDALTRPTEQGEVAGSIVHRLMACFDFSDVLSVDEIRDMVAEEAQAIEGEILASLSHPVSTNMQVAEALDHLDEEWFDCGNFGWCHREGRCIRHNPDEYRAARLSTITASSEGDGE